MQCSDGTNVGLNSMIDDRQAKAKIQQQKGSALMLEFHCSVSLEFLGYAVSTLGTAHL